jgi:hypothetical protein
MQIACIGKTTPLAGNITGEVEQGRLVFAFQVSKQSQRLGQPGIGCPALFDLRCVWGEESAGRRSGSSSAFSRAFSARHSSSCCVRSVDEALCSGASFVAGVTFIVLHSFLGGASGAAPADDMNPPARGVGAASLNIYAGILLALDRPAHQRRRGGFSHPRRGRGVIHAGELPHGVTFLD